MLYAVHIRLRHTLVGLLASRGSPGRVDMTHNMETMMLESIQRAMGALWMLIAPHMWPTTHQEAVRVHCYILLNHLKLFLIILNHFKRENVRYMAEGSGI